MERNYTTPRIGEIEMLGEGLLCASEGQGQAANEELTFEDAIW
ncbi:MAG: hypothetical protein ACI3ZQ_01255 [Candidatus Cryptobacteroides sp.]